MPQQILLTKVETIILFLYQVPKEILTQIVINVLNFLALLFYHVVFIISG
jgi:hypothetical protein